MTDNRKVLIYISESRLIYAIMQELGCHGAVFRCNSGCIKLPNGKYFRGMPKGFSDIMYIGADGIACFIEAKVKPNKPDPEQLAFIEKMQGLGCRAGVAYTLEEAVSICNLSDVSLCFD